MQLRRPEGRIRGALGLLTANLFAASGVHAQDTSSLPPPVTSYYDTNTGRDVGDDGPGSTTVDSAVLFYQEAGGRVRAIEPVVNGVLTGTDGETISLKLTADTLTGATPNGAAPYKLGQTFITPARAPGTTSTVTGSSGGSTIVTIPGTGTVARQYTTVAHGLPVDAGFRDQRYAIDAGYSRPWTPDRRWSVGASASTERDYSSYSANTGLSQDLFHKNTTVSAAINFEFDQSRPYFGTPTPLTIMSASPKGPEATKTVYDLVLGLTQVMTRYWLAQFNYSLGETSGYQTDPYRVISLVDGVTGAPVQYLYESRPQSRLRQSLYFGNKLALGPTVADVSIRAYHDSWGISSLTGAVSYHVPIRSWIYVEPEVRYYKQNAAQFFQNYLISGRATPHYASSDSRLGAFSAVSVALKLGLKVRESDELYVVIEQYQQYGKSHPAGAVGDLANENLFTGIKASSIVAGYRFAFW